ncbi:MAG: flagellar hook-associated protein FlgK [Xanthobacteraceae bacterium]|jgi:flagellar hook-associated protein 1 FlgK
MGLSQVLNTALQGLNVTQTALGVVAGNVSNAQTPGYVEQQVDQVATSSGGAGDGVVVEAINRQLDQFVQQQLWTETSGGAYADLQANFQQQLQQVYGQPGTTSTFDSVFNSFTTAAQALSASPDSSSAQSGVVSAAQAMAQQLNSMSSSIQGLRTQADQGIASGVQQANQAMQQIAQANQQLSSDPNNDAAAATLEDQRDAAITQLSQLMDIRVSSGANNQVTVFTGSGYQLVGSQAAQLTFASSGSITPGQQLNANPAQSSLGTITLVDPSGAKTDLLANGGIRSGQLAAYVQMRDQTLVQAQTQVDQFAAQMSSALSNQTTSGTAVSGAGQAGFAVDVGGVLPGNTVNLTYTNTATNTQQQVTIVRVDDPAALPLSPAIAANYPGQAIGVNFSGGTGSVVAQLNAALGSKGLQFSNPSGTTLQVVNANISSSVDSLSATTTATSLTAGSAALPVFTDGGTPFTGAVTASGPQSTGLAGRITVNSALVANPANVQAYQTSPPTQTGDATRPNFILNQLTNAQLSFSPSAGVGGSAAPFQGTLSTYLGQVVTQQGQAASNATGLQQGQDQVVTALQQRFNSTSAVNIDTEMARLLTLQNAYSANARVISTVSQMFTTLLQS